MRFARTLIAAAAFLATGSQALEICDRPGAYAEHRREVDAVWKSFQAKRFDEVERFHAGLVAKYEAGRMSDAMLARFYSAFQLPDTYVEPLLMEWARLYPESPAAWLALSHYYMEVGFAARGGEYADRTSEAQFMAMGAAFRKALHSLEMADKRTRKHSLSASLRIRLASTVKNAQPSARDIYRAALKTYPESLQARIRYVRASAPKWGGSKEQLQAIVDEAKGLPPEDQRYIEYLVTQEMAANMELQGNTQKAVELYRRSVPMCPGLDRSLDALIHLQSRTNDYTGVIASTTTHLERHPRSGWGYTMRGWAKQQLQRHPEAIADFEKGTQVGYGRAFLNLGWHYANGIGVGRDPRKAVDLYLIAESHGIEDGRTRAEKLSREAGVPLR